MKTHAALKLYFERKRKSAPGFSLRALAGRLDISPSFLSRVLNGQKPIPERLLQPLAKALDLAPELLSTVAASPPRTVRSASVVTDAADDWEITDRETLKVLRAWYFLPILELTTLVDFDGTAAAVAERLQLSAPTTEVALRELQGLGLLKYEDGRYRKVHSKIRFTSSKSLEFIRKFHDEMLEKAQSTLRAPATEPEFERRLITGITISATPERVQAAKRRLAECLHEIANDLTAEPGTEVYHLAAQLFPLTKTK